MDPPLDVRANVRRLIRLLSEREEAYEPFNSKEVMRRSRTTRHETLGNAALFSLSLSVAVPDEIYSEDDR
jgi:hypothetical protein